MNLGNETTTCTYLGHYTKPQCCNPAVKGRSYCESHLYDVYQKGTAVHRKKDIRVANEVHMWESLFNEAVQELIDEGFEF
jgi:hypothetical protein